MKSVIFAAAAVCLMFTSCKDDKKSNAPEAVDPSVKITVSAVVKKDDVFQIFFNEDGGEKFADEDAVTIEVKGNESAQDLIFQLPANVYPVALRFDIGANKDQKEVGLKNLRIEYNDKSFSASGADVLKYFYPIPPVELDSVSVSAKMNVIGNAPYDPILVSTPALNAEIAKLFPVQ